MRKREKRHNKRPFPHVTLAAAVQKAFNMPRIKRHMQAAEILKDWETLVGPMVARHVQPVSLERGILTLQTDSSVWRQQISFEKKQLLDQISGKLSAYKVRELRVK
jgi:predicted nucleic acid-binding Zn ribbon protein